MFLVLLYIQMLTMMNTTVSYNTGDRERVKYTTHGELLFGCPSPSVMPAQVVLAVTDSWASWMKARDPI